MPYQRRKRWRCWRSLLYCLGCLALTACGLLAMLQSVPPVPLPLRHPPVIQLPASLQRPSAAPTVLQATVSPARSSAAVFPRILHQFYETDRVPAAYIKYIQSCAIVLNYSYALWTDADVLHLISDHYPHLNDTYLSYRHPLQRSDFGRYLVIRHFGGLYMDMDVECIRPVDKLVASTKGCFLDRERWEQTAILYNRPLAVMNSVMGCTPGHPFFVHLVEALRHFPRRAGQYSEIVRSTGPLALTEILQSFVAMPTGPAAAPVVLPCEAFSPFMDNLDRFRNHCNRYRSLLPSLGHSGLQELALKLNACESLRAGDFAEDPSLRPRVLMPATYGVHRFLHLGYDSERRGARVPLQSTPGLHRVLRYSSDAHLIDKLAFGI